MSQHGRWASAVIFNEIIFGVESTVRWWATSREVDVVAIRLGVG